MKIRLLFLTLGLAWASTSVGNEGPVILESMFEDAEGCVVLNGLNAQVPINTIGISGDFSLNQGDFPAEEYDDAEFYLRDRMTGRDVFLGESKDGAYAVNIIPGQYDVIYKVQTRGAESPYNDDAVIQENVWLYADQVLDIDVTVHKLSGDLLLNGVLFPADQYDDGTIHLVSESLGQLQLGLTRNQGFGNVPVIAGAYDIYYAVQTGGAVVPRNSWAKVGEVSVNEANGNLDIDVTAVNIGGEFRLNNTPFPASEYDDGNFYLENLAGDRVFLGNSHDQGYDRNVIPGTYWVYWEVETPGATVPFHQRERLSKVSVSGGTIDINVVTWPVEGHFSMNGFAFPNTDLQQGRMLLYSKVSGEYNELGRTKDQSYAVKVIAGTYNLVYQHLDGSDVPQNKAYTIAQGVSITKGRTLDLNVPFGTWSAGIYQNGALFPANPDQSGSLIMQSTKSDDLVLLGSTSVQNYSERIAPGFYDIYYSWSKGTQVPANFKALIAETVEVQPAMFKSLENNNGDLHLTTYSYPGTFLLNGVTAPGTNYDDGNVYIHLGQDRLHLGNTGEQTFSVRAIYQAEKSEFETRYESESAGSELPLNKDTRVGCVKLKPPIL